MKKTTDQKINLVISADHGGFELKENLKKFLAQKYPELNNHFKEDLIRIAVNNEYIVENISLNKNDEIAFFPPVSGG